MPDSETFDAFYARTVSNVTSQLHELAGDDGTADHAIREAYAKAYQQWYQVSGYHDTEAWVLATAKDAYERRRAEAVGLGHGSVAQDTDSGTWPGYFRPVAQPGGGQGQHLADPDATVAPRRGGVGGSEGSSAGTPAIPAAWNYPAAGAMAGGAGAGGAGPTADLGNGPSGWPGTASNTAAPTRGFGFDRPGPDGLGYGGPGRNGLGGGGLNRPGGGLNPVPTRRNLIIAGIAVAALVIAGIAYVSGVGHTAGTAGASPGTTVKSAGKPKPHMLAAGRTGPRSAIPWSLVGSGWALAEFSTAQPNSAGQPSGAGSYTTYLVDPEGGRYTITASSGASAPRLMAWSGDARTALFVTLGATGSYQLLNARTGQLTPLQLPAGVVAVGFTRPYGEAILAVQSGPAEFHLQRYTLTGQIQASVASIKRKADQVWPSDGCNFACALSSPDGLTDVWGITGDQMQALDNAGGKPHKLHVPNSHSCVPLSWWDKSTVLANCAASGGVPGSSRLWLVPADGGSPSPLTDAAGSESGNGDLLGAWHARGARYITQATFNQCQNAPSGPGGVNIERLGQGGSASTVTIPGSTKNVSTIVATDGERLLVLAQTSCPGSSSLVWFDPSAGTTAIALPALSSQAGVIAAVPYGNGPTALSTGQ